MKRAVGCGLWVAVVVLLSLPALSGQGVRGGLRQPARARVPYQTPEAPAPAPGEEILRAMLDELGRSRTLRLMLLDVPYFIEYALHDGENVSVSASLGGLISLRRARYRLPRIQVRVGNYEFDNTNFVGSDFYSGARYEVDQFPLDNSYPVLRHHLWLATDTAYKAAVESLARKRAALKNVTLTDRMADFARVPPVKMIEKVRPEAVDESFWSARLRRLSAVFQDFPQVFSSVVDFDASQSAQYLVNSEGALIRDLENLFMVRVRATTQAPDGMLLRDASAFHALDSSKLPSELDMERGVRQVAENLTALARAPVGEAYNGPVLFEGIAGPQILAELLGRNLAVPRRPVTLPGRALPFLASELEGRLGVRILPEWMDLVDDPTQKEWRGRPLLGAYRVDLEGVVPNPLPLVEKGVLKNFLATRQPVRGAETSNGRARLPGSFGAKTPSFSNLFARASETVTSAQLRQKLIELCRQRNKPYGIIVRKMDFPSSASFEELRRLLTGMAQSAARPVSLPILVYRLYPDGREELIRGLRFRGFNTRSLKDILAASDETYVLDFLDNSAPFALMGGASFSCENSVIAPSLLIDDLEMEKPQEELTRPPLVPPPPLSSRQAAKGTQSTQSQNIYPSLRSLRPLGVFA